MYFKLLFRKLRLFFDEDMRNQLKRKENLEKILNRLNHKKSNLLEKIRQDQAPEQVANVAFLPGIVGHSLAMPDIHWGYGFPIGGVAAFDASTGIVSPGGVGYDIN